MTPKEKALQICQRMGWITFDKGLNNGNTLPLEVAKEFANVALDYLITEAETTEAFDYWEEVAEEIQRL